MPGHIPELDVDDTALVASDHPVVRALRKVAGEAGTPTLRLTNDMLEGYHLSDGVAVSLGA